MKILHQVYEPFVIEEFLRGDIGSKLFNQKLQKVLVQHNINPNIIKHPNLTNTKENKQRKMSLAQTRDFGTSKGFFQGFPENTNWYLVKLNKNDLLNTKYINSDVWLTYTNKSRKPVDYVNKIINSKIFNKDSRIIKEISDSISPNHSHPLMVFVSRYTTRPEVVVEGHHRLTAYVYHIKTMGLKQFSVHAVVGISNTMDHWKDF